MIPKSYVKYWRELLATLRSNELHSSSQRETKSLQVRYTGHFSFKAPILYCFILLISKFKHLMDCPRTGLGQTRESIFPICSKISFCLDLLLPHLAIYLFNQF
ncbi:hypothetical protein ACH5RR_009708 [Cinchona calisaya]|uniref:Uncharacterized protein n=1 Tax=Cinchona calisaya TaxID=153742 RepID=A0ABD3AEY9_9GENT